MQKAMREAKVHTSWLNVSESYEQAVFEFIDQILDPGPSGGFLEELDAMVRGIADSGFLNSLSQTLIKICAPGVPDFYQGTELWEFSLVDPDNRRPVDFEHRKKLLDELQRHAAEDLPGLARELMAAWPDPRVKLFVIWRALGLRRRALEVFRDGEHLSLIPEGPRSEHVFGFVRRKQDRWVAVTVPRFTKLLGDEPRQAIQSGWGETMLALPEEAPSSWRCALTGAAVNLAKSKPPRLPLDDLLGRFPVVLLEAV
jgi:(1->4)-alpha-D-glucan 1-alpha-D-glucosylmutase